MPGPSCAGWAAESARLAARAHAHLAAKLGLVLGHAVRVTAGPRPVPDLLGRLDVNQVDLGARKVLDPRGGRRRRVLADAHLEDRLDRVPQRPKDGVVGSRVVVLRLPEGALVAAVLVQELRHRIVGAARRTGGLARLRRRRRQRCEGGEHLWCFGRLWCWPLGGVTGRGSAQEKRAGQKKPTYDSRPEPTVLSTSRKGRAATRRPRTTVQSPMGSRRETRARCS